MSRRSTRLLSGGYYHSDEESDSSSVTTISYRENPVKVFKKKSGSRRKRSETDVSPSSSRGSAEGTKTLDGTRTPEAPPAVCSAVSRPALRRLPPVSVTAPPSSPSTSSTPSTPHPPSPFSLPGTRSRPGLHFQPQSERAQSAVDSSGYSSSEDPHRIPSSSSSSRTSVSGAGARTLSRQWLTNVRSKLNDMVTGAVCVVYSISTTVVRLACSGWPFTPAAGVTGVTGVTAKPWSSAGTMKLCALLLLLLLLLSAWWTSLRSGLSLRTGPSQTVGALSLSGSQPSSLDYTAVSAAVETKVQLLLREMQLKHDVLLAELKRQMQVDLQVLRQKSSEQRREQRQEQTWEQEQTREQRQEQRLSDLHLSLQQLQAHSESSTSGLLLRLKVLEEQVSQMEQRAAPLLVPSLSPEQELVLKEWLSEHLQDQAVGTSGTSGGMCGACGQPLADKMADFALESQGASVVSTRCSETYRTRSACVSLFGLPLWYPSESPRTVIQGPAVLLPGKCWAFHGVQGTLVIALSHPIRISHVTLDHLPRPRSPTGRIDSAPKDFQVYGMSNETEDGTLLGTFRYNEYGVPTQTFSLSGLTEDVYHMVELRVLSNWGHVQYTCVYRFRVHGQMTST